MRQEMKSLIDAAEQGTTRAVTDLDVRMQSLKQKVSTLENALDSRISEVGNGHVSLIWSQPFFQQKMCKTCGFSDC